MLAILRVLDASQDLHDGRDELLLHFALYEAVRCEKQQTLAVLHRLQGPDPGVELLWGAARFRACPDTRPTAKARPLTPPRRTPRLRPSTTGEFITVECPVSNSTLRGDCPTLLQPLEFLLVLCFQGVDEESGRASASPDNFLISRRFLQAPILVGCPWQGFPESSAKPGKGSGERASGGIGNPARVRPPVRWMSLHERPAV